MVGDEESEMISDESTAPALPAPKGKNHEARLLVQEAKTYTRAESKERIKRCTGERLFREEPRRYRLIAAMRAEGLGMRETCRAALCDPSTVASVERREAESTPTVKRKLTTGFGQLARMTLERLQEAVPDMNHAQLAVTAGIATDKFTGLIGDPNLRIEHTIQDNRGNIFDRMAQLQTELHQAAEKIIKAKAIEPEPLQLQEQT